MRLARRRGERWRTTARGQPVLRRADIRESAGIVRTQVIGISSGGSRIRLTWKSYPRARRRGWVIKKMACPGPERSGRTGRWFGSLGPDRARRGAVLAKSRCAAKKALRVRRLHFRWTARWGARSAVTLGDEKCFCEGRKAYGWSGECLNPAASERPAVRGATGEPTAAADARRGAQVAPPELDDHRRRRPDRRAVHRDLRASEGDDERRRGPRSDPRHPRPG